METSKRCVKLLSLIFILKFLLPFKNLHSISRTLNLKQVPEKVFSRIYYNKASNKSVVEVIFKKLQRRCYTVESLELLYMIKVPSFSCNFQALAVAH